MEIAERPPDETPESLGPEPPHDTSSADGDDFAAYARSSSPTSRAGSTCSIITALQSAASATHLNNTAQLVTHLQRLLDQCDELENSEMPALQESAAELERNNEHYREMVQVLLSRQKEDERERKVLKKRLEAEVAELRAERESEVLKQDMEIGRLKAIVKKKEREVRDVKRNIQKSEMLLNHMRSASNETDAGLVADKMQRQLYKVFSNKFDKNGTMVHDFMYSDQPEMMEFVRSIAPSAAASTSTTTQRPPFGVRLAALSKSNVQRLPEAPRIAYRNEGLGSGAVGVAPSSVGESPEFASGTYVASDVATMCTVSEADLSAE